MYVDDSRMWRKTASPVTGGFPACSGSDGKMCVGAFLHQKTFVFVALLFTVLFAFSVITSASTDPFPHKGDLHLPQGTTVIPENAVTGIEEGDLYIPSGATLHLESNATFIWNPGYSIHNEGQITWDSGARLRKGYLCVSVDGIHGCSPLRQSHR